MTRLIARIAFAAALLPSVLAAEPVHEPSQEYSWDCPGSGHLPFRRELLVSTEELAKGIEASEVIVVHVGFETSGPGTIRRAAYSEGHIPGARHLKWADLKGAGETLSPAGDRWPALAALGLPSGRRVVLYDTGLGVEAAAAFVALESVGLADHAALLDGQWVKWAAEGRPLCRWGEEAGTSDLVPRSSAAVLSSAGIEPLLQQASLPRPAVTLLDARTVARGGQNPPKPFLRMSWAENLASLNLPMLKSEEELRRRWAFVPSQADHRVLVAAQHWREAAHVYFVARLLGYSVQLFDGSIEDLEGFLQALERGP